MDTKSDERYNDFGVGDDTKETNTHDLRKEENWVYHAEESISVKGSKDSKSLTTYSGKNHIVNNEKEVPVKCCIGCCSLCFKLSITFFVLLSSFTTGFVYTITGPTFVLLVEFYEESESATTSVFIAKSVGLLTGSYIMGPACDIASKSRLAYFGLSLNKLLFMAMFLIGFPMICIPLIPWLWSGILMSFFQGCGFATLLIVTTMMMKIIWPAKVAFGLLQLVHLKFALGAIVGPLFTGLVYRGDMESRTNLLVVYLACGIVGLLPCFIICFPSPRTQKEEEENSTENIEEMLEGNNNKLLPKESEDESEVTEPTLEKTTKRSCFERLLLFFKNLDYLRILFIGLGCMNLAFFISVDGTFQSLQFLYLVKEGWEESVASFLVAVYYIAYATGRGLGAIGGTCVSPVQVYFFDVFGLCIVLGVMLLLYNSAVHAFITVTGIFLTGFFCSTGFVAFLTMPTVFGIEASGLEVALLISCAAFGRVTPPLATLMIEEYSPVWFLIVEFGSALGTLVVWYLQFSVGHIYLYRKKRREEKERLESTGENLVSQEKNVT